MKRTCHWITALFFMLSFFGAGCGTVESPLSSVPFHRDIEGLQRFVAAGFPYHLAVHKFVRMDNRPEAYTQPHAHPYDEL